MTGNAAFPTPSPALTVLEDNLTEYRVALVNATLGDRQQLEIKNQKRRQLERTLRALAMYVEPIADGNAALILGAGFEVAENIRGRVSGPRPKPVDANMMPGRHGSGMAEVRVKRDRKARFNRFEYRPVGQSDWTVVQTSRSWLKLEGLTPMSLYELRVAYLGTNPSVTYSDVVTAYAG